MLVALAVAALFSGNFTPVWSDKPVLTIALFLVQVAPRGVKNPLPAVPCLPGGGADECQRPTESARETDHHTGDHECRPSVA